MGPSVVTEAPCIRREFAGLSCHQYIFGVVVPYFAAFSDLRYPFDNFWPHQPSVLRVIWHAYCHFNELSNICIYNELLDFNPLIPRRRRFPILSRY